MPASTTVRVNAETHRMLRKLSRDLHLPIQEVIREAIMELDRKAFWRLVHKQFLTLRSDPRLWADELREREEWDGVLGDGLERK